MRIMYCWLAMPLVTAWCAAALADPVAYWRHEEGTPGALIPAGPDTVLDSTATATTCRRLIRLLLRRRTRPPSRRFRLRSGAAQHVVARFWARRR